MGLDEELAHSSIRFGLGRFNTEEEVDYVAELLRSDAVQNLLGWLLGGYIRLILSTVRWTHENLECVEPVVADRAVARERTGVEPDVPVLVEVRVLAGPGCGQECVPGRTHGFRD